MKRLTMFSIFIILLVWSFSLSAADTSQEVDISKSLNQVTQEIMKSQGVSDMKSIDCSKVTDKQLEDLGDAFMDTMHPDTNEHKFMDRMMGGENSPTLSSMKRIMGARYLGCYRGDEYSGMMSRFWGGRGNQDWDDYYNYNRRWWHMPMMYGYGPWGMMGGGPFMWILFLILLAIVVYLVVKWTKPTGASETPLDILKKRYAKGEITKDEFDQKKKDLGL